jgi:hypothetical protein
MHVCVCVCAYADVDIQIECRMSFLSLSSSLAAASSFFGWKQGRESVREEKENAKMAAAIVSVQ